VPLNRYAITTACCRLLYNHQYEESVQSTSEGQQRYNPAEIEPKWQARWDAGPALYAPRATTAASPSFYCLEMLPYPSGSCTWAMCATTPSATRSPLHVDCAARTCCIPWAGTLRPARENAALKNNTPPAQWTLRNIAAMRQPDAAHGPQLRLGHRSHHLPAEYYRWNQWFFLKMYARGWRIARRARSTGVPSARPCLANEQLVAWQVLAGMPTQWSSSCDLTQWFLRITKYADELLAASTGWTTAGRRRSAPCSATGSAAAKARWWIRRQRVCRNNLRLPPRASDTIFGATSVQLCAEHAVAKSCRRNPGLSAQIDESWPSRRPRARRATSRIEKHGVDTGKYRNQSLQWRTCADLGCKLHFGRLRHRRHHERYRHDERDFEFAN